MDKNLIKYLDLNHISYEINVDLKKKTWIHRGGMCDVFISPLDCKQLLSVVRYLYSNQIKFQLLGHTSNVYILNTTNIPIVVSTQKCNKYELIDNKIICESGVSVIRISNDLIKQGISGFEYLTGLPGTIGGAIYNNSSCKNNSISQLLLSAEVLLEDGRLVTLTPEDMQFKFRTSIFKEGRLHGVIISAVLRMKSDDSIKLLKVANQNKEDRKRVIEGHAKNLGCTVNRCFINGKMPLRYYIPYKIYLITLKVLGYNLMERRTKGKNFLCNISGFKNVAPYISNLNPIIFIWKDNGADDIFPFYLDFMKKVYKTDKVEIEIIK